MGTNREPVPRRASRSFLLRLPALRLPGWQAISIQVTNQPGTFPLRVHARAAGEMGHLALDPARESRSSQFRKTYAEAAGASTNANAYIAANARYSHLVARIVCVAAKNLLFLASTSRTFACCAGLLAFGYVFRLCARRALRASRLRRRAGYRAFRRVRRLAAPSPSWLPAR
jgi:hypothetical protein